MYQGLPQLHFETYGIDEEIINEVTESDKAKFDDDFEQQEELEWAKSKESGIPVRFQNASFKTFNAVTEQEKTNLHYCKNFVENKGRQMLMFLGQYGNGKTHLGTAIVRACRFQKAKFTSSFEICTRYEMGSDFKAGENKMEVLERYTNYEVLVIDEVGRANPNIERLILPYLINARYENQKRTVLITNLKKDDVMNLLGEATVDRLKEICSTLKFTEESKRGKVNEQQAD